MKRLIHLLITGCYLLSADTASIFKPKGAANVLFFIASDCPISNTYAPVIQQLCSDYGRKGIVCALFYEDVEINPVAMRKHLDEYRYQGIAATIHGDRRIANRAKATITPEAVVVDGKGEIRYRGRIDNRYADFGKPRQHVTANDLRDALDAVLAGKPVAQTHTEPIGCFIPGTPF